MSLIKTAKKANLTFTPLKLFSQLKLQLPVWFHMGAPPQTYHESKDECLKTIHRISKVKNLMKLYKWLWCDGTNHVPWHNCKCRGCKTDH